MSIVSDLIGGAIGSSAAHHAADVQSASSRQALSNLQGQQENAQNFQNGVWQGTQQNYQPYLGLGNQAAGNLLGQTTAPGQGLLQAYGSFQAPTMQDAENDPGYQFALQQGTRAINQNAAANGTLMSGNTGTALQQYGQGLAGQAYNDVYNRALNTYNTNQQNFNQNQSNQFNRLAALAGLGQSSASQLGGLGQSAANTNANIDLTSGQQQAQQINNVGAARASGIVGGANAWQGALSGLGGAAQGIGAAASGDLPWWAAL